MILTDEQIEEFKKASDPLIEFLNELGCPHISVVTTTMNSELSQSICTHITDEYLKD